ncbi:MAG: zinc-ribbon domain-containing protein [Myxococcota bacterium]
MIAGCPKCSAKYRVDAERIGPDGAKLRCTKCSAVFLVRAPQAAPVAPVAPAAAAAPIETPVAPAPERTPAAESSAPVAGHDQAPEPNASEPTLTISEADRQRLVVVADPDEARAKSSAEALTGWGLLPHVVHDGVEAMLSIQRLLPSAVVLDAALPKMFGFQVCEVIKRNESLRETVTVLVGAIHHQDRYRRTPTDLYGADVYVEQPDLPEGLLPILREAGLPIQGGESKEAAPVSVPAPAPALENEAAAQAERTLDLPVEDPTPEPAPEVAAAPAPALDSPTPSAPAPAPVAEEDPERKEERERAERLARIAVSEMLLYQPEKFDQAARDGNLETVLDMEISEARALLRQRISEEVRAETDFVMDELLRVAKERSA